MVLVHPEIPPNTGNVGRLCVAAGITLHLVRPLGFRIDDRSLKRAGLDYWKKLNVVVWQDLDSYLESVEPRRIVLTSSRRGEIYHAVTYSSDDHILFGAETTGLPAELFARFPERIARIPVRPDSVRSLNLSTSAGIVVYEALRQTGGLE
ncbi:MAG: tRNA (cytidine(34)-2'-O)-methyltransferase [Thermodesulfobacteriota bacterium]